MSRRRRRVKIKSSSRLFAFILFNLLLLASCITAHYQPRPQSDKLEGHTLQVAALSGPPESPPTTQSTQNSQNQNNQLKPKQDQIQMLSNIAPAQTSHQPLAIQSHFIDESSEVERVTNHQLQQQQHQPPNRDTGGHHLTAATTLPSIASLCSALPVANARQLRLCRLVSHSPNANEAVALGAARGLAECRQQFRSERWNCTHAAGDHHLLTSKLAQSVGNRESGFVQAIAAAGIVHSIATACSTGSLNDCACDKSRVGPIRQRDQNWKWGGCSNNIRHGMMYARHLVELLDAVHEHHHHHMQRSLGNHRQHGHQQSLAARCQQLRRRRSLQTSPANSRQQDQQQQQQANFCQRNQNISQTIHIQLIKSLLAKNSLERHQDFRLAMNAHNNRVGRMAVAKNMEIKCRCHGLSGSCSLKTCWLKLPDFQQIGAYLKRKYEGSIHLPTAINVNKLIPMMDRNELSAILLQQQQAAVGAPSASEPSLPESANSLRVAVLSTEQSQPEFAALSGEAAGPAPPTQPARLNFYERHKQQPEQRPSKPLANSHQPNATSTTTSLFLHGDEVPVHIAPMSQQQYQTLLREMRLCNSSQIATRASRLTVRDLQNHSTDAGSLLLASQCYQLQQQQQQYSAGNRKLAAGVNSLSPSGHNEIGGRPNQGSAGQRPLAMSQAQLGHLLQGNNREELVHLHKSPDYCEPDLKHGFAGVQARLCSNDPQAPDSCDRLCCGRGFERREIELRYNCDCKFQYCCKIHCNVCQKTLVEYVCK